jgi:hypothetical protein
MRNIVIAVAILSATAFPAFAGTKTSQPTASYSGTFSAPTKPTASVYSSAAAAEAAAAAAAQAAAAAAAQAAAVAAAGF